MTMKGYEIKFNVYAENEEEAKMAEHAIKAFISQHAQAGRAVTGRKIAEAIPKWESNAIVRNRIINYFR
jgi:hypothetical protein